VIIDKATGSALAELDWRATPTMLHEQAIYHTTASSPGEKLDWENHKAFVTKVCRLLHDRMSNRKVSVIEEEARSKLGRARALGRSASWRRWSATRDQVPHHENAGYGDVRLPTRRCTHLVLADGAERSARSEPRRAAASRACARGVGWRRCRRWR